MRKSTRRVRNASRELVKAARALRQNATPAEKQLWSVLRNDALGHRFRRQHPVGRYILDFYRPAARLVIELDGAVHEQQADADAERTAVLNRFGYEVVRIPNARVESDLTAVIAEIKGHLAARIPPSGTPLPPS